MELPFEVLNQTDLDTERTKLNKNIQENIEYWRKIEKEI